MKKVILYILYICFAAVAWPDVASTYNSLDSVLNEPYRYWHLTVNDNNQIVKASTLQRIYLRASSIFSDYHKNNLQHSLEMSLHDAEGYLGSELSDDELITLDKICSIVSHMDAKFWFKPIDVSNLSCKLPNWKYTKKVAEKDYNWIWPYENNGLFSNDQSEAPARLAIVEIVVFLKSIFSSPSNIDLKELQQRDPVIPFSDNLNIQWLGHASFLIQIDDINILVDPVTEAFHPLLGGMVKCFKRYIRPGIELIDLPKIDVVLISHNHLDHLEDKTLQYLKRYQPQILVPEGLKKYFDGKGFENVSELMWWDEETVTYGEKKVNLYAVPARHNSMARGPVKRQESLWCGWVIEAKGKHIYFAGDTAFNACMFRQIKERFKTIDVALMPVAPDKMWERHIDHLDAIRALRILDSKVMIPMHWGAYRTGDEKIEQPYFQMMQAKKENPDIEDHIKILKVGERYQE